jgi:hypothetical protein
MQSPLRPRNWIIFILINIFVSALTAFIVVRAVTQAANRSLLDAAAAPPAAVAHAPTDASTPSSSLTEVSSLPTEPALQAEASPASVLAPVATQPVPTSAPQTTRPPAASPSAPANVRISTVVYPGQRTREAVVIVNEGDQVDMTGWTLSSPRGQTYTFGSVLLFKESFINLHTTRGVDVPTDLFWNLDKAAWQAGDTATLKRGDQTVAEFAVK